MSGAPRSADERLVSDVGGSWKVSFRKRRKQNGLHWQWYAVFVYTCVSSAIVLTTECSKQR